MGVLATHAVVMAWLISKGKDYGVQAFIVWIWDQNHKPMSGLDLGDIGPKMNWEMKDNGYLAFDKYRIPWENMLMRYSALTREGEFKQLQDPKLLYSTMLLTRLYIL